MTSFSRHCTVLLLALFLFALAPPLSSATGNGTVVISIQKENDGFVGNWYLHRGTTSSGFLVRNGTSGESFEMEEGSYYLEVRNVPDSGPYYLLHSDNPQFLDAGGSITFNVEYFETEEAMLIASGNPPDPEAFEADETVAEPDIYDSHGCNSSDGYVWCARSESCVRYWTPSCKLDEVEAAADEDEAPTVSIIDPTSYREVPDFNMAPVVSGAAVPTFEMAPANFDPTVPEDETAFVLPVNLAQTGPSAVLALFPALLAGWAVFRKRS